MLAPFSYSCPTKVHFGAGTSANITDLLPEGAQSVILVRGGSGRASAPVLARLQATGLKIAELECNGEPTVMSIDAALLRLAEVDADAVISCGGGSAIDTGKTICFGLAHGLSNYDGLARLEPNQLDAPGSIPHFAVPTTAGTGGEVTANAVIGIHQKHAKISLRGRGLFPSVAIIDPDLMRGAPDHVILNAGLDAVTQALESYTSNMATPFSDALTVSVRDIGLPALRRALDHTDPSAIDELAWVSHVSGLALANSGLGAAHGLASVIGGKFDAPHGALCGRLLLPVLRQNALRAPSGSEVHARIVACIRHIADIFPTPSKSDPLAGFDNWLTDKRLPRLADWSVSRADLGALAAQGMKASSSQKNAVPLELANYREILEAAL